jgi:hypothetical protein
MNFGGQNGFQFYRKTSSCDECPGSWPEMLLVIEEVGKTYDVQYWECSKLTGSRSQFYHPSRAWSGSCSCTCHRAMLVETGFTCINQTDSSTLTEADCSFGAYFNADSTFSEIPDENFNITYADGEYLNGVVGYEDATLAGILVKGQEVGVVNLVAWDGRCHLFRPCRPGIPIANLRLPWYKRFSRQPNYEHCVPLDHRHNL